MLALLAFGADYAYGYVMKQIYPMKYDEYITKYSEENNLDPYLVMAVIKCESGFNPNAVSGADAKGLMQMIDPTFEDMRHKIQKSGKEISDDIFDPETAIMSGTRYLRFLKEDKLFADERTMLAAYNAGLGTVGSWLKDTEHSSDGETLMYIPYGETEKYVERVLKTKEIYKKLYNKTEE